MVVRLEVLEMLPAIPDQASRDALVLRSAEARVHELAGLALDDLVAEHVVLDVLRDILEVGHIVQLVGVGVDDQDVLEAALLGLAPGVLEVQAGVVARPLAGVQDPGLDAGQDAIGRRHGQMLLQPFQSASSNSSRLTTSVMATAVTATSVAVTDPAGKASSRVPVSRLAENSRTAARSSCWTASSGTSAIRPSDRICSASERTRAASPASAWPGATSGDDIDVVSSLHRFIPPEP